MPQLPEWLLLRRPARSPRWRLLAALAATVVAIPCAARPDGMRQTAPDAAAAAQQIVDDTNALRRAEGLAPTSVNPLLAQTAAGFAAWMAAGDHYGHEADGRKPAQRTEAAGYAHCLVAENIAWRYDSRGFATAVLARRFAEDWADSPPHRHNMLEPLVTETGVALARSPASGRWYGVQLFGRPLALRVRFTLVNRGSRPLRYAVDGKPQTLAPNAGHTHSVCGAGSVTLQEAGQAEGRQWQAVDGGRYTVGR